MERKVAFVTGAGMGVGYGMALEYAKAGYDVAIHHSPSSAESAQELCRRMEGYGAKTLAIQADLMKFDNIKMMFDYWIQTKLLTSYDFVKIGKTFQKIVFNVNLSE